MTKKVEIGKVEYFQFFIEDGSGIYQFAVQSPFDPEPKVCESPLYLIKFPVKAGTSWEGRGETFLTTITGKSVNLKCTIESIDDVVTVPAGIFKNCLRIKRHGETGKIKS